MIQDIYPYKLDNQWRNEVPDENSYLICVKEDKILARKEENTVTFPQLVDCPVDNFVYLFSVDEKKFFLGTGDFKGFDYISTRELRDSDPLWISFAGAVAAHLAKWYDDNKFCGKCGKPMHHSKTERAMECDCGNIVYPRINPVVIVSVLNEDKILVTRYTVKHSAYRGYALIAGFAEIGETIEDTVRREVLEETGVKVKNVRFYKSQPWPFSQSLIFGFVADLDGDDTLTIDEDELQEAEWLRADQIPDMHDNRSVTGEMIEMFRAGKLK